MKNKLRKIRTWHIGIAKTYLDLFESRELDKEEFALRIVDSLDEGDRKIVLAYIQNYIDYKNRV
jgi:hypothetical protein